MPVLLELEARSAGSLSPTESCASIERSRQARLAVLTGLGTFAGLLLITAIGLDAGPFRDPEYRGRLARLRRQFRPGPKRPFTVVILGSSRTREGIRAPDLKEQLSAALGRPVAVGNFGLNGCGPIANLMTWNRLLRDGLHPDVALIEILPAMLNESWVPTEWAEEQMPLCGLRHSDLPVAEKYCGDLRPGLRWKWYLAWPNSLYDQRLNLVSQICPALLPFEHRVGESPLPEDEPVVRTEVSEERRLRELNYARAFADRACLGHFRLGGRCCASIRELLAAVRRDGRRAVLIVLPEGPEFRSWYEPGAYEQVRDWLAGLKAEFGVELLDARAWMEESDFRDSLHLTQEGAAKFTVRLGAEFLILLVQGLSEPPSAVGNGITFR